MLYEPCITQAIDILKTTELYVPHLKEDKVYSDPVASDLVGALLSVRLLQLSISRRVEGIRLEARSTLDRDGFTRDYFFLILFSFIYWYLFSPVVSLRAQRGNLEDRRQIPRDYLLSELSRARPVRACRWRIFTGRRKSRRYWTRV